MPSILDLVLLYLCFKNGSKAKRKGLNGLLWGILSAVAMLFAMGIGMVVVLASAGDKIPKEHFSSPDPKVRAANVARMAELLAGSELNMLTVLLFGIGGYLLIRYILDRRPDKPEAESDVQRETL